MPELDSKQDKSDLLEGFQPLGNYAVIERDKAKELSAGGLYIPQAAQDPTVYGVVTHVGTGQKNGLNGNTIPMIIEVGDRVAFHPSGVQTLKIKGIEVEVIHEGDIIGFWRGV